MAKKNENVSDVQRAYVGPAFKSVSHCTVYIGDLPQELQEAQEKCKAFNNLIVTLDNYLQAQIDLQDANSVIAISFKKAQEFLKEGV